MSVGRMVVVAVALAGCSQAVTANDVATDGATADAMADAASVDVAVDATGGDAGGDAAVVDASGEDAATPFLDPRGGEVNVSIYGTPRSLSANAAFWIPNAVAPTRYCPMIERGACTVRRCSGVPDEWGVQNASAGTITLTGGDGGVVTLTPDARRSYGNAFVTDSPWRPGEDVTISASGDGVGAFSATLRLPAPLTVTEPSSSGFVLDRQADFIPRWVPGEGEVRVQIAQNIDQNASALEGGLTIQCVFPSSAGRGLVPASVIDFLFPSTAGIGDAVVVVYSMSSTSVRVGDYTLRLTANTGGTLTTATVQ